MRRPDDLIGQRDNSTGTKIDVQIVERSLIERREEIDYPEVGTIGRSQFQYAVTIVDAALIYVESAVAGYDENPSIRVDHRGATGHPDAAQRAIGGRDKGACRTQRRCIVAHYPAVVI